MATIPLPIVGQEISKANFGDPVANQVNTNTADIANLKAPPWIAMALVPPWSYYNASTHIGFQYYKKDGLVYVSGVVKGGTSQTNFCQFPTGYRPPLTTYLFGVDADVTPRLAFLVVASTGLVTMFCQSPVVAIAFNGFFPTSAA